MRNAANRNTRATDGIIPAILIPYTSQQLFSNWDIDDTIANSNAENSQHAEADGELIDFNRN